MARKQLPNIRSFLKQIRLKTENRLEFIVAMGIYFLEETSTFNYNFNNNNNKLIPENRTPAKEYINNKMWSFANAVPDIKL